MSALRDVLDQVISSLRVRAREYRSPNATLESNPFIDLGEIKGELLSYDNEKITVNRGGTLIEVPLAEAGSPIVVEWRQWRSRGGYYGDHESEYGGEPPPICDDLVKKTINKTACGAWEEGKN